MWYAVAVFAAWPFVAASGQASGSSQDGNGSQTALVVEGIVREVFVSPRASRIDILTVIEVQAVALGPGWRAGLPVRVPAPGELAYVHSFVKDGDGEGSSDAVPPERGVVRVRLAAGEFGGWQAASADWFELTARERVARRPGDPEPPASDAAASITRRNPVPADEPPPGEPKPRILGVVADPVSIGTRVALKVTEVMPGSPAAAAGLEAGDVILEANGAVTTTPEQLANAVRRSGNVLKLTVRNVRTGENVPVTVNLGPPER
jgi:hypothetical protein